MPAKVNVTQALAEAEASVAAAIVARDEEEKKQAEKRERERAEREAEALSLDTCFEEVVKAGPRVCMMAYVTCTYEEGTDFGQFYVAHFDPESGKVRPELTAHAEKLVSGPLSPPAQNSSTTAATRTACLHPTGTSSSAAPSHAFVYSGGYKEETRLKHHLPAMLYCNVPTICDVSGVPLPSDHAGSMTPTDGSNGVEVKLRPRFGYKSFADPKLWMDTPAWVGNAKAATSIIEAVKTIPTIIQISFAKNLDSIKIGFDILRELASNPTTNPDVVRDALLRLIAEFAAVPKRKQLGSNNNRSSKFFQPFFTNHLFLGLPEIYQKQLRAMVPALKAKTSYEEFE